MRSSLTPARWLSFALLLILAALVSYWGTLLLAPKTVVAPGLAASDGGGAPNLDAAKTLFGSTSGPAVVEAPSDIQVNGVVQAGPDGIAILTVGGKPPAFHAVGTEFAPRAKLVAVQIDKVIIERNGERQELKAPARGSIDILTGAAKAPNSVNPDMAAPVSGTTPSPGFTPPAGQGYSPPPVYTPPPSPPPTYTPPPSPAPQQPGMPQNSPGVVPNQPQMNPSGGNPVLQQHGTMQGMQQNPGQMNNAPGMAPAPPAMSPAGRPIPGQGGVVQ